MCTYIYIASVDPIIYLTVTFIQKNYYSFLVTHPNVLSPPHSTKLCLHLNNLSSNPTGGWNSPRKKVQCEAPKIAKLANNYNNLGLW